MAVVPGLWFAVSLDLFLDKNLIINWSRNWEDKTNEGMCKKQTLKDWSFTGTLILQGLQVSHFLVYCTWELPETGVDRGRNTGRDFVMVLMHACQRQIQPPDPPPPWIRLCMWPLRYKVYKEFDPILARAGYMCNWPSEVSKDSRPTVPYSFHIKRSSPYTHTFIWHLKVHEIFPKIKKVTFPPWLHPVKIWLQTVSR